jgi:hypothetical protein
MSFWAHGVTNVQATSENDYKKFEDWTIKI